MAVTEVNTNQNFLKLIFTMEVKVSEKKILALLHVLIRIFKTNMPARLSVGTSNQQTSCPDGGNIQGSQLANCQ